VNHALILGVGGGERKQGRWWWVRRCLVTLLNEGICGSFLLFPSVSSCSDSNYGQYSSPMSWLTTTTTPI